MYKCSSATDHVGIPKPWKLISKKVVFKIRGIKAIVGIEKKGNNSFIIYREYKNKSKKMRTNYMLFNEEKAYKFISTVKNINKEFDSISYFESVIKGCLISIEKSYYATW